MVLFSQFFFFLPFLPPFFLLPPFPSLFPQRQHPQTEEIDQLLADLDPANAPVPNFILFELWRKGRSGLTESLNAYVRARNDYYDFHLGKWCCNNCHQILSPLAFYRDLKRCRECASETGKRKRKRDAASSQAAAVPLLVQQASAAGAADAAGAAGAVGAVGAAGAAGVAGAAGAAAVGS